MVILGTIVVPASGSKNNTNTSGTPFAISPTYQYVLLVVPSDASGFNVTVNVGTGLTATTNDYNIGNATAATSWQFKCPPSSGNNPVVAIYTGGIGGSVRVYGLFGLAQGGC